MKSLQIVSAFIAAGFLGTAPARAEPIPMALIVLVPGDKLQTDAFTEQLRQVPYLKNAKTSDIASNVIMFASMAKVPTTGGSAATATTGLLAATTLGLIPTVENQDVSVHYELRANGITLATFDYSKNFTSVSNLFGEFGKLPEEARVWMSATVTDLARDMQANKALNDLQAEYDFYFPKK